MQKYLTVANCDYDIIYWNRHNVNEETKTNKQYAFNYFMDEGRGKLSKLLGYIKFKHFAKKILLNNQYDGVIVFTASAGILLGDILIKHYNKKYIVDIRDYAFEKNPIFFALEKRVVSQSYLTVISSKGYLNFLPVYNRYILVHNDIDISQKHFEKFQNKTLSYLRPIVISYIGLIRFHEQNKRLIKMFGGDDRFILRFIGKDANSLEAYCKSGNFKNIELVDWFPPEKTLDYYYETDVICNLYGNHNPLLDYALSNKLYYAATLNLPILVCPDTFMAKITEEFKLGFVFNFENESVKDELLQYYLNIDWEDYKQNCQRFNEMVMKDNLMFTKSIKKYIEQL